MKTDELDERMRQHEYFHALKVLPGLYSVVRVDGRSFTKLTREMEHPFDDEFHNGMVATATALLSELGGVYAFTESDEISVLLPRDTDLFGREVEKIVSVSAGIASSTFSLALSKAAHFDGRLWVGATDTDVLDYFRWRQADATRCGINSWCYWTLRKAGSSAKQATDMLKGLHSSSKNELLFKHGVNFNSLPIWQKRGVGLYWENYDKPGYNPMTKVSSVTTRRRVQVDLAIPRGEDYADLIADLIERSETKIFERSEPKR